jgi:S1-C subfamily serine protease
MPKGGSLMYRALTSFFVVLFSIQAANPQTDSMAAQPHKVVAKGHSKTLSLAELHEVARSVSVLIAERTPQGGTNHIGSGVWLAEGVVATCWHVVKDTKGPIKISLGTGDVVTVGSNVMEGVFMDYTATVVASDADSDIAILKTKENPFKATSSLVKTPTQEIKPKLRVARLNADSPVAGTLTVLSGYPLSGLDLVSQTGNVAGTSTMPPDSQLGAGTPIKGVRLLVSVVSNPGNSGGPVLNEYGELIGLLEGNLSSPVKDGTPTAAVYFRPKKGADGKVLTDANGNPQLEIAVMYQNSGISLVVPSRMIVPLLRQAEDKK